MHRDFKPSNMIMTSEGEVKLIDFNSAKIFGSAGREHTVPTTTLNYASPEQLLHSSVYGPPTDIWSVGCIFAELFMRDVIFGGQHLQAAK